MLESPQSHLYVWASRRGITLEPCEDEDCTVGAGGRTSCGSVACPSCGRGGANLSSTRLLPPPADRVHCGCGYSWVPA